MMPKKKIILFFLPALFALPVLLKAQAPSVASRRPQPAAATEKSIADNYTQLEMKANVAFTTGRVEEAKYFYEKALKLQPDALWPVWQLSKIEAKKSEVAKTHYESLCNYCYTRHRTTADSAFNKRAYSVAHAEYTNALKYKHTDSYASSQIARIEKMERDAQYTQYMKTGKEALASSLFSEATAAFEQALKLRANDAEAKRALAAVAGKKTQQSTNEQTVNKDLARLTRYNDTLAVADELFRAAAYQAAKAAYKKAEKLNPQEPYARRKINEIDSLLALRKQELEALKKDAAETALYSSATSKADKALQAGDLKKARLLYEAAQQLKAGDDYASQKISAIDAMLLEEDARRKSAATERSLAASANTRYNELLVKGNAALIERKYEEAKDHFTSALAIKPFDASLRNQVDLINKKLESQRIEGRYNYFIRLADSLAFKAKDKRRAITYYDSAHTLKPAEGYAMTQVILINDQLSRSTVTGPQQQNTSERSDKFTEAFKVYRKADEARIEKKYAEAYTGFSSFLNQLDVANPGLYQIGELYYINQAKDYVRELEGYKSQPVDRLKETSQEGRRIRTEMKNDK